MSNSRMLSLQIKDIRRYPVKGFRGQKLSSCEVIPSKGIKGDRAYAILKHDEMKLDHKGHARKLNFLNGVQEENLPRFYIDQDNQLFLDDKCLSHHDKSINLDDDEVMTMLTNALPDIRTLSAKEEHIPLRVEKGFFADQKNLCISVQNCTTLKAFRLFVEQKTGADIASLETLDHWRGNLLVDMKAVGAETLLKAGDKVEVSGVLCEVIMPIERCNQVNKSVEEGKKLEQDIFGLLKDFAKQHALAYPNENAYMGIFLTPLEEGIIRLSSEET